MTSLVKTQGSDFYNHGSKNALLFKSAYDNYLQLFEAIL